MILDAFTTIYVWVGPQSTEQERKSTLETACEYVQLAPDNRPKDAPVSDSHSFLRIRFICPFFLAKKIWQLKAGEEPYVFTTHFHGWDYTKRKTPQSFNGGLTSVREILAQYHRKYTYLYVSLMYALSYSLLSVYMMNWCKRNIHRD